MSPKLSFWGRKNRFFFWGGCTAPSPDPSPAPHHVDVSPPPFLNPKYATGCGKKEGRGKGRGGNEAPADFCYSFRYSSPQMLDLSGRLAGRVVQSGEGGGRKESGRER